MKKFLVVALALVLSLALAVPVMAADVDSDVTILGEGQGLYPIIKCKWETPDNDPATPGTQVDPPLAWGAYKNVTYWAVVTDPEGVSNIAAVYADVYHPQEGPEYGSFKYQEQLMPVNLNQGINNFTSANSTGLLHCASGYDPGEILEELKEGSAVVYKVVSDEPNGLYYEQPWGDYTVTIKAVDKQAHVTELTNYMYYVPVAMCEVDFTTFSFGPVSAGDDHKLVDGDTTFVTPAAPAGFGQTNKATIRNIGNTLASVTIYETDLYQGLVPLGKTGDDWNVEYDARLGNAQQGTMVYFDPEEQVTLPDILGLSTTDKLDFSIQIKKLGLTGSWLGQITVGCDFADWPE